MIVDGNSFGPTLVFTRLLLLAFPCRSQQNSLFQTPPQRLFKRHLQNFCVGTAQSLLGTTIIINSGQLSCGNSINLKTIRFLLDITIEFQTPWISLQIQTQSIPTHIQSIALQTHSFQLQIEKQSIPQQIDIQSIQIPHEKRFWIPETRVPKGLTIPRFNSIKQLYFIQEGTFFIFFCMLVQRRSLLCHRPQRLSYQMPSRAIFLQFSHLIFCHLLNKEFRETQKTTWSPRFCQNCPRWNANNYLVFNGVFDCISVSQAEMAQDSKHEFFSQIIRFFVFFERIGIFKL